MSATPLLTQPAVSAPEPKRSGTFRPDIEGLRAVAVLLVVAFHAGVPLVSGGFVGVDVFFVISGFLITGLLANELQRTGRLSLTGFYARRVRRLLPLSTVVLVAIAVGTLLIYPMIDRPPIAGDIQAAALWYANWHFAAGATNYMAGVDQSPVLHYWSLSVEEQFYVVWPLLILFVAGRRNIGRRAWRITRARLTVALGLLFVVSFTLSVLTTGSSGPWAYFGLQTRAWELAAGGLLALGATRLVKIPRLTAVLGGYVGVAAVVLSAIVFSRATSFPGWAAAVPVGGTILMLAAGARSQAGVSGFLSLPPMTYIGRISYGWYLWHWPCLVFAKAIWGQPTVDPDLADAGVATSTDGGPGLWPVVGAVVVSFLLAGLTYRIVEAPVRESRRLAASRPLTLGLGAVLVATAVLLSNALLTSQPGPAASAPITTPTAAPGAVLPSGSAGPGTPSPSTAPPVSGSSTPSIDAVPAAVATMTPDQARADVGTPSNCFVEFEQTTADPACRFGSPTGTRTVALIGDSHAAHWFPAMEAIAKRNNWQLLFWAKPACGFAEVRTYTKAFNREYTECADWRASVFAAIAAEPRMDAVVIGRSFSYPSSIMNAAGEQPGGDEAAALWGAGAKQSFETLAKATPAIVVIREIPRPGQDVPACLSEHPGDPAACGFPRQNHTGLDQRLYDQEVKNLPADDVVHFVDFTNAICISEPCSVISPAGAILFRDLHHLTGTFSRELAPVVQRAILPFVGRDAAP